MKKTVDNVDSMYLFQNPLYKSVDGKWNSNFQDAVDERQSSLTWDPSAILSLLSFNYVCGDHTLLCEVKRQPWLSEIKSDGSVQLKSIPPHGFLFKNVQDIANRLDELLCQEAETACSGYKEIYLLLSGGLDSRVVGGILSKLYRQGRISTKPVCVTWGVADSRDVAYGRRVAGILDFPWEHLDVSPADLRESVISTANCLGSLVTPGHTHGMNWFQQVSPDALVLAASYGDSVGRAEFSGCHLSELRPLVPHNTFGLLRPDIASEAQGVLNKTFNKLWQRSGNTPDYAVCEIENQAHYMRGMIAHAMGVIDQFCSVYQMFTAPAVYSYMWSLHPSCRNDSVYACLLENLDTRLARTPWARTNRALSGTTSGKKNGLTTGIGPYSYWIANDLYDEMNETIEPSWFEATGLFDGGAIKKLSEYVKNTRSGISPIGFRPYELWLWLASFRHFSDLITGKGRNVKVNSDSLSVQSKPQYISPNNYHGNPIKRCLKTSPHLIKLLKQLNKHYQLKKLSIKYPPL